MLEGLITTNEGEAMGRDKGACHGCFYFRPFTSFSDGAKGCHYILVTGEPRGCPVDQCDKWTEKPIEKPDRFDRKDIPDFDFLDAIAAGRKERAIFERGRKYKP